MGTHSDVDRKRVTLLYRPIPSGRSVAIVEADKRNAEFGVNGQARVTARASTDLKAAPATATEEARGSGLVNFGMVVTATVTELDRLDDAKAALTNLSAGTRILLAGPRQPRPCVRRVAPPGHSYPSESPGLAPRRRLRRAHL